MWLGQRLDLRWIAATSLSVRPAVPLSASAHPAPATRPVVLRLSAAEMAPLLHLTRLGYTKGILNWLDDWVHQRPDQADFAHALRTLAREFRFEAIEQRLLAHSAPPA